ncbi:hypothetical protein [Candidatus Methylacidithermus pantelleriae]|uniref:Uncharacterized protein n=1 Tax=Candidatus Methylacidithermus pantelleriae TaxID=2744239 RepID=A0A8J2BIW2_9BACT|nr:hypothetical protein [Candidatus Methylacidithermus pantelleriae]CAF0698644.1 hypothetical protein MPNT_290012 [Candidatus Methylacidithermus pantelleriae]
MAPWRQSMTGGGDRIDREPLIGGSFPTNFCPKVKRGNVLDVPKRDGNDHGSIVSGMDWKLVRKRRTPKSKGVCNGWRIYGKVNLRSGVRSD